MKRLGVRSPIRTALETGKSFLGTSGKMVNDLLGNKRSQPSDVPLRHRHSWCNNAVGQNLIGAVQYRALSQAPVIALMKLLEILLIGNLIAKFGQVPLGVKMPFSMLLMNSQANFEETCIFQLLASGGTNQN